jgi:hypothetical protein
MSLYLNTGYQSLHRTANIPAGTNFSVSGWVRCSAVQITGFNSLFVLSDGALNDSHTAMLGCHFNNNNTDLNGRRNINANVAFSALPSENTWIYVALSCSGSGTNLFKGYWWQSNGTLGGTFTATADQAGSTFITMVIGARYGVTIQGHLAYWRVWDAVLTQSEFEAELPSPTIVRTSNINTAIGTNDEGDVSGNGRNWTLTGATFDTTGDNEPPVTTLVKKLKVLVHPDAASASAVEGIVWAAGGIAGAEYGEFTGKTFEATTEGSGDAERAVLLVPVADFGGGALNPDDVVPCLVRNATYTTGIITGTVIEE